MAVICMFFIAVSRVSCTLLWCCLLEAVCAVGILICYVCQVEISVQLQLCHVSESCRFAAHVATPPASSRSIAVLQSCYPKHALDNLQYSLWQV